MSGKNPLNDIDIEQATMLNQEVENSLKTVTQEQRRRSKEIDDQTPIVIPKGFLININAEHHQALRTNNILKAKNKHLQDQLESLQRKPKLQESKRNSEIYHIEKTQTKASPAKESIPHPARESDQIPALDRSGYYNNELYLASHEIAKPAHTEDLKLRQRLQQLEEECRVALERAEEEKKRNAEILKNALADKLATDAEAQKKIEAAEAAVRMLTDNANRLNADAKRLAEEKTIAEAAAIRAAEEKAAAEERAAEALARAREAKERLEAEEKDKRERETLAEAVRAVAAVSDPVAIFRKKNGWKWPQ